MTITKEAKTIKALEADLAAMLKKLQEYHDLGLSLSIEVEDGLYDLAKYCRNWRNEL